MTKSLALNRREFVVAATAAAIPFMVASGVRADGPRVRKNVMLMDSKDPFFKKYGDAVNELHKLPVGTNQRNWRNQALIHLNHCVHGGLDFVHWHRHYINYFETICAKLIGDTSFALPYWDWTAKKGVIPDPFFDNNFLNVSFWNDPSNASSPNWAGGRRVQTIGVRSLKKGQGLQDDPIRGGSFRKVSIDQILRLTNFSNFTRSLEGSPHNNAHVVAGAPNGHMGDGMSPLDPIFWLHHCNVDRLWAQWQAAGNQTPPLNKNYSGQFVDASGNQVTTATSANALDIKAFGYTYDIFVGPQIAELANKLALQPFENQTLFNAAEVGASVETLATSSEQRSVKVATETRFTVAIPNLVPKTFAPRTFWAPDTPGVRRLAVESRRVLAIFSEVAAPPSEDSILVNAFINCPYLSPETPASDPHYAGTFSFFGSNHMNGHGEFIVDITEPLRALEEEGQLSTDEIQVQLMAIPAVEGMVSNAEFTVGKIEIRAV